MYYYCKIFILLIFLQDLAYVLRLLETCLQTIKENNYFVKRDTGRCFLSPAFLIFVELIFPGSWKLRIF